MKIQRFQILAVALLFTTLPACSQEHVGNNEGAAGIGDPADQGRTPTMTSADKMDRTEQPRDAVDSNPMTAPTDSGAPAQESMRTDQKPANDGKALSAGDFYHEALKGGRTEIELSKIALDVSKSKEVLHLAQMIVTDHTGFNSKLQQASNTDKPAGAPDSLAVTDDGADPVTKRDLQAKSGDAFDRAYLGQMSRDHAKAIALFERAAADMDNAKAKQLATEGLPALRKHAHEVDRLQSATSK